MVRVDNFTQKGMKFHAKIVPFFELTKTYHFFLFLLTSLMA